MFKVRSPILDFFELVLKIMFELATNIYYKGLEIIKVLLEEKLKLLLGYENILAFIKPVTMLILGLLEADTPAEEKSFKQGAISLSGPSNVKIIFAFLTEVITVHM